jgi:anti-sigma B factor antagonist
MEFDFEDVEDVTIVSMRGELDNRTALSVQEAIMPTIQPYKKLLVNMSGVSYVSSAGLRTMLLLYREVDIQNGRIILCSLPEMVYDTMFITGFMDFFTATGSVAEGLEALRT